MSHGDCDKCGKRLHVTRWRVRPSVCCAMRVRSSYTLARH
jgi:hypothetical protein